MSSAVDPNLNPVIVAGAGGGGATLPDDPAAVLLDAGAPSRFVALNGSGVGTTWTAAQALAVLYPEASVSLASGTGWTADVFGAGSSASITGGAVALVGGASPALARIGRAVPWGAGAVQVYARLSAATLGAADEVAIFLCNAVDGAEALGVTLYGNGDVRARNNGTDGGLVAVADMLAGQGWLRLDLFGDTVDAYAGAGVAGAVPLPAAWQRVGFARSSTAALSGWAFVRFQLNGIGATASFNDFRYRVVTP